MKPDRDDKSVADRRGFMKLAVMGTALGGVAIAAGGKAKAATPADTKSSGYRETDHIKRYYELSRF